MIIMSLVTFDFEDKINTGCFGTILKRATIMIIDSFSGLVLFNKFAGNH